MPFHKYNGQRRKLRLVAQSTALTIIADIDTYYIYVSCPRSHDIQLVSGGFIARRRYISLSGQCMPTPEAGKFFVPWKVKAKISLGVYVLYGYNWWLWSSVGLPY
jgi:hypothetical protein